MLEPTKRRNTTAYVNFSFRVPADRTETVKKTLAQLGAEDVKESTPWEEVYPDFSPRVALRGARKREGVTQTELADRIGVAQVHISQMENGKRTIGKVIAKRLAESLKVDYRVFL